MGLRPRKLSDTAAPHANNTAPSAATGSQYANATPTTPHVTDKPRVATSSHAVAAPRSWASRAARMAEDHDGNHQEWTTLCRPGNAVTSTRRMPQPMPLRVPLPFLTAVNRRHSPPPPRCIWLCVSVRKFCWAMVLGCTRLIECSGYFFLVQLTLCTLYNLTKKYHSKGSYTITCKV